MLRTGVGKKRMCVGAVRRSGGMVGRHGESLVDPCKICQADFASFAWLIPGQLCISCCTWLGRVKHGPSRERTDQAPGVHCPERGYRWKEQ